MYDFLFRLKVTCIQFPEGKTSSENQKIQYRTDTLKVQLECIIQIFELSSIKGYKESEN